MFRSESAEMGLRLGLSREHPISLALWRCYLPPVLIIYPVNPVSALAANTHKTDQCINPVANLLPVIRLEISWA